MGFERTPILHLRSEKAPMNTQNQLKSGRKRAEVSSDLVKNGDDQCRTLIVVLNELTSIRSSSQTVSCLKRGRI